ncbi:MAG: transcription termination factor NusA [Gammaproteobacteria bacterium]|nr:transcription termination factor NusA [Gammaproteobacteria bacterium]
MMDSKEILAMMDALSVQRGIKKESVALALEVSIAAAVSRQMNVPSSGAEGAIQVKINRDTGTFVIYRVTPKDLEEIEDVGQIFELAEEEVLTEEVPNLVFERVAIQAAKQLIMQKVREAERQQLADNYQPLVGKLVPGTVKRITRNKDIIVLLNDRVEAVLPYDDLLAQDQYDDGDDISAVLVTIDVANSSNQLFLSRTSDDMVRELFSREVPEISQQIVEICAISRLPGVRSKVAIRPKDHRIDAMSACIGLQGKRVQAVQKELGGEKIDILEWDDNPEQLVKNVLANPNIFSVTLNPDSHTINVAVPQEHIGEILGRNGQNIRLATLLIGWEINVMKEEDAKEHQTQAMDDLRASFIEILDADEDVVQDLLKGGFDSVKQLGYAPIEKFLRIEGFDEDLATEIRNRAREHLLSSALNTGDAIGGSDAIVALMSLKGMTEELATKLSSQEISSVSDLAEYSVDELEEVIPDIGNDIAAEIILDARKVQPLN